MPNIFGAGLVTIMPLSNFGGDHYGDGTGGGNPDGGTSSNPEGSTPPDPGMPFFLPPPGRDDGPGEM